MAKQMTMRVAEAHRNLTNFRETQWDEWEDIRQSYEQVLPRWKIQSTYHIIPLIENEKNDTASGIDTTKSNTEIKDCRQPQVLKLVKSDHTQVVSMDIPISFPISYVDL